MRRKDREITDANEIVEIIKGCDVLNLGLCADDMPYVVPVNFGYDYEDGRLSLYIHGAKSGKKHDIIAKNPNACFSMDRGRQLVAAEEGASYTMLYESVMGYGKLEYLTDPAELKKGLALLMRQYEPDRTFTFTEQQLNVLAVLKLTVEEFTGKRNRR